MTTTNTKTSRAGRLEGAIEVVILIAVASMAGAASFTHVHDWTMANAPAGTGSWFGWANAMVSELIPLAAGLEARRRKATYGTAGKYPVFLILAAVALSLTGQFGEAKPSISGWVISAVPAAGFLALVKLILSRPTGTPAETAGDDQADTNSVGTPVHPAQGATTPPPVASRLVEPVAVRDTAIPAHLLTPARFAATNHRQTTGRAITAEELSARISISPDIAGDLVALLNHEASLASTTTRVNGAAAVGGAR